MKVQSTEYLVHNECSINVECDDGEEEEEAGERKEDQKEKK